jgi:heme exporter protein A
VLTDLSPSENLLRATGLACRRGERRLFKGVGFDAPAGSLVRVIGRNGSGKTSLLRLVAGLSTPDAGAVYWKDRPVAADRIAWSAQLLYLGHASALKDDLDPAENLEFACRLAAEPVLARSLTEALARLGIAHRAGVPARFLSQGQRRRVALARLALTGRPVWVLDEPFVGLDAAAIAVVEQLIGTHLDRGGIVLLTTHQPIDVAASRQRVVDLDAVSLEGVA